MLSVTMLMTFPAESIELVVLVVIFKILRVVKLVISISDLLICGRVTTILTTVLEIIVIVVEITLGPVLVIVVVIYPRPRSMRRRRSADLNKSSGRVLKRGCRGSGGRDEPRTMKRRRWQTTLWTITVDMRLRGDERRTSRRSNGGVRMSPRGLGARNPEGWRSRQEDQFLDLKTEPQLFG
jgi:hypothetical protein